MVVNISGRYKCVLQLYDVATMRSSKSGMRKEYICRLSKAYPNLENCSLSPVPGRANIVEWVLTV